MCQALGYIPKTVLLDTYAANFIFKEMVVQKVKAFARSHSASQEKRRLKPTSSSHFILQCSCY